MCVRTKRCIYNSVLQSCLMKLPVTKLLQSCKNSVTKINQINLKFCIDICFVKKHWLPLYLPNTDFKKSTLIPDLFMFFLNFKGSAFGLKEDWLYIRTWPKPNQTYGKHFASKRILLIPLKIRFLMFLSLIMPPSGGCLQSPPIDCLSVF